MFPRKKIAIFTDIHWGRKNNSVQHNEDCTDFIKFFCDNVRRLGDITHVAFLGDWFENRNAVNVLTLTYAHEALIQLNALGLPVYFIIGNHDLYHRENRKIFSTKVFQEFSNITMVSEPHQVEDLLFVPFLFKNEYPELAKYKNIPYWLGHFEFKNFVITGSDRRMDHGPDHTLFSDQKFILSGHFHKRQATDNVCYVGSPMGMDYGDVWDDARGMAILDTGSDELDFIDWEEGPKYRKLRLSDVLNSPNLNFPPKCRVRCLVDVDISYSEAQALREDFTKEFNLREFSLEEDAAEKKDAIAGDDEAVDDFDLSSLNDAVIEMLRTGITGTTTIEPERLIAIYSQL